MLKVRSIVSLRSKLSKLVNRSVSTSVEPKEEKKKVGEYDINYLKVGNGAHTVLCMPGALGTIWTNFKPQIEEFDREKFTLVVWDPPGYGKSRPPEKEFGIDFHEKDAHMAHEFMKALKIPKYSMLGWSGGAITSMIHAAKYPSAVNKLVFWAGMSYIMPHEMEVYKKTIESWIKNKNEQMTAAYGEELFIKYAVKWGQGMERILKENDGNICSELLKDIKCPTFILYGQKDPIVDSSHVTYLNTHIAGSRIHLYPDGKHNIHIKYAQDFNKRVQEFLLSS